MIGLLIGLALFLAAMWRLSKWFKGYYIRERHWYSANTLYVEFMALSLVALMASVPVGLAVAKCPVLLIVPVACYGLYRASRWWFDNKIAK